MISIVSALWQRMELTEIFLDSLVRYRKDYGIQAVVTGSEGKKTREMCQSRGVGYIEMANKPISNKFIRAAQSAMVSHKPSHLLVLGSDDFVDDAFIRRYLELLEYDIVGILDCYFYNTKSKETAYWCGYTNFRKGETVGMGRMLSKNVYEKLRGRLWPAGMNSGLDYTMMQRLKKVKDLKYKKLSMNDGLVAVDIKGEGNITRFDCFRSNMTEVDEKILKTIPEFSKIEKL